MTTLSSGRRLMRILTWFLGLTALAWCITTTGAIPAGERAALIDLYNSTNGATWSTKTNWNGAPGTECTWYGVICDAGETTVESISMDSNNLTGTLPSTLANLTNLRGLVLTRNYTLGGPIPATLGSLAQSRISRTPLQCPEWPDPRGVGRDAEALRIVADSTTSSPAAIPVELGNLANLADAAARQQPVVRIDPPGTRESREVAVSGDSSATPCRGRSPPRSAISPR